METQLAKHLLMLATEFCRVRALEESTVGRFCAADGRFFSRIRDGKTFTVRKYDEVAGWFSVNWPDAATWPDEIERPATELPEAAE